MNVAPAVATSLNASTPFGAFPPSGGGFESPSGKAFAPADAQRPRGFVDRDAAHADSVADPLRQQRARIDRHRPDRPYRAARSWDDAAAEILAGRGRQFDPDVVDAFREREPVLRGIRRELAAA